MMWMEFLLGPYFGQFQWHQLNSQPGTGSFWLKFCHGTYIVIEKPEYTWTEMNQSHQVHYRLWTTPCTSWYGEGIYYIGRLCMSMFQYRLLCFHDPHLIGGNAWRRKSNACVKKTKPCQAWQNKLQWCGRRWPPASRIADRETMNKGNMKQPRKSSLLVLTVS